MVYFKIETFSIFIIISFLLIHIQSQNKPSDSDQKRLDELKEEVSQLQSDNAINNMIVYILIGVIVFFLIIIIVITIYELINCYMRNKRELLQQALLINSLKNSGNQKNSNNSNNPNYGSKKESYSTREDKSISKTINSFHSSNFSEGNRSRDEKEVRKEDIDNNYIQKPNPKESFKSRNRLNSGYEAPIVEDVNNNNINYNNSQNVMTNDGNNNKDSQFMDNPYRDE